VKVLLLLIDGDKRKQQADIDSALVDADRKLTHQ
jgi:hypothetical protein